MKRRNHLLFIRQIQSGKYFNVLRKFRFFGEKFLFFSFHFIRTDCRFVYKICILFRVCMAHEWTNSVSNEHVVSMCISIPWVIKYAYLRKITNRRNTMSFLFSVCRLSIYIYNMATTTCIFIIIVDSNTMKKKKRKKWNKKKLDERKSAYPRDLDMNASVIVWRISRRGDLCQ